MQRSRSIRPKSPRLLDREIHRALSRPTHATRETTDARLPWKGQSVRIDPSPRTIKSFELDRPYVVRHRGKLYTIVSDVWAGNIAHPAIVEGRTGSRTSSKRSAHATKAKARDKSSDKINIDQLAELLGLPSWERIDELNQQTYWEMAGQHADEEAQMDAERAAQDEVYHQWYDAVEQTADTLFGEHGLELQPTGKQGTSTRRYDFKIVPANSWEDAAKKIRETLGGIGDVYVGDSVKEFLRVGSYKSPRQAVLSHLGAIKRYPHVYGGPGAHQMYEQHWR